MTAIARNSVRPATRRTIERFDPVGISNTYRPALRYSSPWPWALAICISSTIWVGVGWLFWTFAQ